MLSEARLRELATDLSAAMQSVSTPHLGVRKRAAIQAGIRLRMQEHPFWIGLLVRQATMGSMLLDPLPDAAILELERNVLAACQALERDGQPRKNARRPRAKKICP